MKTYTVKEIADMLKTNPETIRRWIREGKLAADQHSRKTGNVVAEQTLRSFAKSYPKYSWLFQSDSPSSQISGIVAGAVSVASGLIAGLYLKKAEEGKIEISASELSKAFTSEIDRITLDIRGKEETIKRLQAEIDSDRHAIVELKRRIEEIDPKKTN